MAKTDQVMLSKAVMTESDAQPADEPRVPKLFAVFVSFRRILIFAIIAGAWQLYGTWLNAPLLFPSLTDTLTALINGIQSGELLDATWQSVITLFKGYAIGVALAVIATTIATTSRFGSEILETLTAMFNPLPAIALLPLALIWFGLGEGSLIFVLVHSVLWAVALNMSSGFRSVSPTWRMVGHNYGLSLIGFVRRILLPGAFPSILAGLKVGWAFAWRTLIAAELVFGVSSGGGGLGWFIYNQRNQLETPSVFAGLVMIMLLGVLFEYGVFRNIERVTVRRWGMHVDN